MDLTVSLQYMFNNGINIYTQNLKFHTIPPDILNKKITQIFNTNNTIRSTFFTNTYIKHLISTIQQTLQILINDHIIIQHIITMIKPLLFSTNNNIHIFHDII